MSRAENERGERAGSRARRRRVAATPVDDALPVHVVHRLAALREVRPDLVLLKLVLLFSNLCDEVLEVAAGRPLEHDE